MNRKTVILFALIITSFLLVMTSCSDDSTGPNDSTVPEIESQEMIFVEGGTFQMGDRIGGGESDELPLHDVTVSDFYMGKFEVTQGEWESVMGSNPAHDWGVGPNHPVYYVSWYSAVEYCNALSNLQGLDSCYTINGTDISWDFSKNGYRLPTEAEWEYAARGGINHTDNYKYSGTSDNLGDYGWYDSNSDPTCHEFGTKLPNQLGIYDMSGNLWEWCWDWNGDYSAIAQTNPSGPESGIERIRRGGNWGYDAYNCRVSNRYDYDPSTSSLINGFRLSRTAE